MSSMQRYSNDFLDGVTNDGMSAQALAFAVAALQAMPSSSSYFSSPQHTATAQALGVSKCRLVGLENAVAAATSAGTSFGNGHNGNCNSSSNNNGMWMLCNAVSPVMHNTSLISGSNMGTQGLKNFGEYSTNAHQTIVTNNLTTTAPSSTTATTAPSLWTEEGDETLAVDDDPNAHSSSSSTSDNASATVRLQRSRERNREHARKTRLRKKAHLQTLQQKYQGLVVEKQALDQRMAERSIASILLDLSSPESSTTAAAAAPAVDEAANEIDVSTSTNLPSPSLLLKGRKRGYPAVAQPTEDAAAVGSEPTPSQINWKAGTYSDAQGRQRQLTAEQLETVRRERNRRHAKMTRDRKKCFVSTMEQAIADLEKEMARIRSILALDSDHRPVDDKTSSSPQTESLPSTQEATAAAATLKVNVAAVTPEFSALPSPKDRSSPSSSSLTTSAAEKLSPKFAFPAYQRRTKRACQGFSLDD